MISWRIGCRLWLAIAILELVPVGAARAQSPTPAAQESRPPASVFVVKPYLQLGAVADDASLSLLWHTTDEDVAWSVQYRTVGENAWRTTATPTVKRVAVPTVDARRIYRAVLAGLPSGVELEYQVIKANQPVFSAKTLTRKKKGEPYRFVAFGDCGADTPEQKAIAFRTHELRPDFVTITGDIVYGRGRISEYQTKFWPIYNADAASPAVGVPLMRSTLFISAPGNHDIAGRDFEHYPDGLAYYFFWDQPLNGIVGREGGALVPLLHGPETVVNAFRQAAGDAYPRMANYSFDYNDAHWTILDSNPYVDWTNTELRRWVERDLAAASGATWKFVNFHHPGFNSSKAHFEDQQMRLMADVFEAGHVDIVFSGHVHNYQRTFPLTFVANKDKDGKPIRDKSKVGGQWTLDKAFDGLANTHPKGVIYLITGAGGNHLYDPAQQDKPETWQPFTTKFISKVHSLTVVDVHGSTAAVRQLTADGKELDAFTMTK
jgi:acid phosphatase type 7